ncbi:hypothetical protein BFP72_14295 [Reichenbachiella sp. 5M10]|nr:hypothetical protein BFP72_14295 [Reichenbachiella sp. 5M10]
MVIDPKTILLNPPAEYALSTDQSVLRFDEPYEGELCFRIFPIQKGALQFHKSASLYDSTVSFYATPEEGSLGYEKEELFATPDIYKTGSLTRGVSFGNSQSVNVISSFNFQMDGKLTDNLNIRADITDQNVPFQPEGNTQQIREFDNVTFEIYNENLSVLAGDVVLQNGESYFLKHYKNALGGQVEYQYAIGDKATGQSKIAVAAAKGQFADITLAAEEGVQGPYQLYGPDGQQYVVVLANSESVYLDGQLLKRGFNHDYVIDYNLGELTFNPKVMITQFSRLRVTFEYSDQNYSRSIIAAQQGVEIGRATVRLGYYREKDNRNRPLAFALTPADQLQMSQASDDQLPVPIAGETLSEYNANWVMYERRDTVDSDGNAQQVFVYSRDSTAQLYRVTFSDVEQGAGDYQLVQNDVNGRVYEWVSAVSQVPQGRYAPVRFVPAPNQKEMFVLGAEIRVTDHLTWYSEVAVSNQDKNLYAEIDDDDNSDFAAKSGLVFKDYPLGQSKYRLSASLDYEYDGGDFKPIDRYRPMEYDRNWSYTAVQDTFRTSDHIFNAGVRLDKDRFNLLRVQYANRQKDLAIDGNQLDAEVKKSLGGLKVSGGFFDMDNVNASEKSEWRRWYTEAYFDPIFVVPGYRYETDRNEVGDPGMDSLTRTAMNYGAHQFYLRSNDTLKTRFRVDYTLREDKAVLNGLLVPYTFSKTATAQMTSDFAEGQTIGLNFTYRDLAYQSGFESLENEKLVLGNLDYRGSFFKRHVRMDMTYTTSSSREILREFIFVEVATGEGTHAWRDLNSDGVQDLTEFFEAINFDERQYIKVFVPTTDFIEAYNTIFTFTLNFIMPRSWKEKGGFKQVLSKVSSSTNININKKSTEDSFASRFNPFSLDIQDVNLVFVRDGVRSTWFYNRSGQGLGLDLTYASSNSKQLVSRGIESRHAEDWLYNMRFHLNREWVLTLTLADRVKQNASQYSEDRNYLIHANEATPGVTWQPQNNFRLAVSYSYLDKVNLEEASPKENSQINAATVESRWSSGVKNALTAAFTYTNIAFEGAVNSAAAYELLNALQPGDNYTWQVNYSQKLFSGLQMSLGYEGRKSADNPLVHMGRMQITALF